MDFIDAIKQISLMDIVIIAMLEMGYTPTEIADKADITRQTVYTAKKRTEGLAELVNSLKSE